jgi:hypothetical protein
MQTQPSPYTNQPFSYPNGITTASGARVPRSEWEHFSQYSDAQRMLAALQQAPLIDGDAAGNQLQTPLKVTAGALEIVDGIQAGFDLMFAESNPYDGTKPIPANYVTTWTIVGTLWVDGIAFVVDEYVGDLVKRFTVPEGVDVDESGSSQIVKLLLMQNVSGFGGPVGIAEATYRA